MASTSNIQNSSNTSSSAAPASVKYDVFVSFQGEDTRHNFTDHLFAALQRKGIFAFRDDNELKKGESIGPEFLRAIEESHVYVVVLSKNYASSTWCLGELESILHCVQRSQKSVLPIFYEVEPSIVRKLNKSYGKALAEHEDEDKFKEMVPGWRAALTQIANLSGWEISEKKSQSKEIEKIVEVIANRLGHKVSSLPNNLVGMQYSIAKVEKLLLLDIVDDVRVVGICGMGGVGKTTLANALYGKISHQFDACCFVDNLSKIYRDDGVIGAQKQILQQTLGDEPQIQICNYYDGASLIQSRLGHLRVFIVLDNVDHIEHLEKLAVSRKWLAPGSRVVIVSRDADILKKHRVDVVYRVPLLNETDSYQLFCQQAPDDDNIEKELACDILTYANGLPLAIKALGSLLLGQHISEWKRALNRLRESPTKDIMDVLQLSFDGLEEIDKTIFLDIACFFNGGEVEYVGNILDCCGFHPEIGLSVLNDKSLISTSDKNMIEMHSLLEELGRKIVQENESRKWSRLWLPEHFGTVVSENLENKVEAVVLRCEQRRKMDKSMTKALSKMSCLRLLILVGVDFEGSLKCLSSELKFVKWDAYPFKHLPPSFQSNQLVELFLPNSKIKYLWEGKKEMPHLRTLDLMNSINLIKMPDFRDFLSLERLNLKGCHSLEELDPSIGILERLVYLNLENCENLKTIPDNIFGLSSLKYLNFFQCSKAFLNMKDESSSSFSLPSFSIKPSSYFTMKQLSPFSSGTSQTDHIPLPKSLTTGGNSLWCPSLPCLRELDVGFCSLSEIPDAIGNLHYLERLNLGGNDFVTLPSFMEFSKLSCLNLEHCKKLKSLPKLPSTITIGQDDMFSHTPSWRTAGLYIFNCPKLSTEEVEEMCHTVVFSWMIQFMQANQAACAFFRRIDIVVPGREMPEWFNNRVELNLISIDPSPIMHDNSFIAVAFCVVVSLSTSYDWGRSMKRLLQLRFSCNGFDVSSSIPVYTNQILDESTNIWIAYLTLDSFFDLMTQLDNANGENLVQMEVFNANSKRLHANVKNCGYRWVYKHDLENFNVTMMHRKNSLAQDNTNVLAIQNEPQPQEE